MNSSSLSTPSWSASYSRSMASISESLTVIPMSINMSADGPHNDSHSHTFTKQPRPPGNRTRIYRCTFERCVCVCVCVCVQLSECWLTSEISCRNYLIMTSSNVLSFVLAENISGPDHLLLTKFSFKPAIHETKRSVHCICWLPWHTDLLL